MLRLSSVLRAAIRLLLALVSFTALRAQNSDPSIPTVPAFAFDLGVGAFSPKKFTFTPGSGYVPCTGVGCPGPPYQSLVSTEDLGINFAFRPKTFHHRFLQADFGYDWALRADPNFAVGTLVNSQGQSVGNGVAVSLVDFLTLGGRAVLPLFKNRVLISAGGGADRARDHQEPLQSNTTCEVCAETRHGWGSYEVGEVTVFVAHSKKDHVLVGLSFIARYMDLNLNSTGNIIQLGNTSQRVLILGGSMSFQGY